MEFQHELIIPNEGLPFKLFLFEGRNGNYVREKQTPGTPPGRKREHLWQCGRKFLSRT